MDNSLLRNLILFGRLLRSVGVGVSPGRMIEFTRSLEYIDLRSREDFRAAARCMLVSRHDQLSLFDAAFDAFWRVWEQDQELNMPIREAIQQIVDSLPKQQRAPKSPFGRTRPGPASSLLAPLSGARAAEDADNKGEGVEFLAIYSPTEALRQKNFAQFTPAELVAARRFMSSIHWDLTRRRSRRRRPAKRGHAIDVRRSLRRSLRHGGEMMELARRGPKLKRRRIVLLCDISGSMERYTRLLLHFLHAIETTFNNAEVFVFGTRLTRISRQLRHKDPDAAIAAVSSHVVDWAGGTRIGEALRTFNRHWARRVMGQGAIVIIISDGWDRGDVELLRTEMERLQRASYRLLWLNPLLGSANYRPLTQGIQAALPYVDDFLPIHNLASLEDLAGVLNQIQEGRAERKQRVSILPPSSDLPAG
jgi:uncharacterized protein with von Willebrand factor type A (vWA) domain